jgi:hypothetical protein
LNLVLEGLSQLEENGVETIDCRRAQFSGEEPIMRLRMICQSWKVMFQAEYSSGQPLRMLVDLRASIDAALGASGTKAAGATAAAPSAAPRAFKAAAANGHSTASPSEQTSASTHGSATSEPPEFEISIEPQEWKPDGNS